jgi:seryl-tRNA synthetase
MIDINLIRKNPNEVKTSLQKRNINPDIDSILSLDKKRKEIIQKLEKIRFEKNKNSRLIPQLKEEEKRRVILQMKEADIIHDELEEELKKIEEKLNSILSSLPNIPLKIAPVGKDEKDNVVLRNVGKIPKFKFPIKSYLEIGENLDLIDVKRASKIAGTRFGILKSEAVLIEFALIQMVFDNLLKEGFIPIIPPVMLKEEMAKGTGYFEAVDRKEAYFLPEDNMFLIGTSEQSLIAMHAQDVFEEKDLPVRYVAFSTCFRREAGSYGKDTKGILRVHQFDKIEMISFCKPEDSLKEHKFILSIQEKLMKKLKLPYRVVHICTGDMGRPAANQYDIETWMPSENRYRETHSTSNCTDFQARRLNIKYRKKNGDLALVHTLNGTAFAIGRILIMIMENYQLKNGRFKIPNALKKYLTLKNNF